MPPATPSFASSGAPTADGHVADAPDVPAPTPPATAGERIAAWAVHALTMSGLAWATLATLALINGQIAQMWLWLGVALIVDGVDGTLARRARVKQVVPWFDGGVLDIVIDYLTWTFIPALFLALHLPTGPGPVGALLMVLILASSMFCYANEGWKSTDNYFVGFPAAWNVVAVAMWVLGTPGWLNILLVVLLAVATLIPTHYGHPFRVRHLMVPNAIAVAAWMGSTAWLVAVHPVRPVVALVLFWVGGGWFLATGLLRTLRGRRDQD